MTNSKEERLPSGTVTFLFSDIEGSTRLLETLGSERYADLLAKHRKLHRNAFEHFGGLEIDAQGDSFFASFPRATDAVAAVVEIQRALATHHWPEEVAVQVRMGLHTGEPWLIEKGYVGMAVHRAARIAHVGHGGQVLLSGTTTPLVQDDLPSGVELTDLGRHRLKDLRRPEPIHQLMIEGLPGRFPPLTSIEDLSTSSPTPEVPDRPSRQVGPSPYRGLAAFHEKDAAFFFGREAFTDQLRGRLQQRQLVAVVVGSSGSGKSSTVYAGLLPQLRETGEWLILSFRPGSDPFHALATTLVPQLAPDLDETDRLFASERMANGLQAGDLALARILIKVLEMTPGPRQILLVIDQFEELYTLVSDPTVRNAFLDEMLATMAYGSEPRRSPARFLLTLRADFMGQALTHRSFADALQLGALMLGPMNRDELLAAIERPADLQGAAFEPGLVTRILEDVGEEPGNLPLLEFALTLLWDRNDNGWLTHQAYDDIGRVEGALARYADQVYGNLSSDEQAQARRTFVQLVQPGQGTEDTRRVARREDLVEVAWGLVQHLADHRLVVTGVDESGKEIVEVVHEAMIRSWGQLRIWMAADRDFRSWQEGLRVAQRSWEASDQDPGALLRGGPLAQAAEWLSQRGAEIGAAEHAFVEASLAEQQARKETEAARVARERELEQRALRRLRAIVTVLVVASVVGVILTAAIFNQNQVARRNEIMANQNAATAEAERVRAEEAADARATQQALAEEQAKLSLSRELASAAINNLDSDPERSILLALHALSITHTIEAERALHRAVQSSHLRKTIHIGNFPPEPFWLTISPDGQRLFVSGKGGGSMWDVSNNQLVFIQNVKGPRDWINGAAFNPDNSIILMPLEEYKNEVVNGESILSKQPGRVIIVDVKTGEELFSFQAHDSSTSKVTISPNGKLFATVSDDQTAKIWDLEATLALGESQLVHTLLSSNFESGVEFSPGGRTGEHIIFSPDGDRLVTKFGFDIVTLWDVTTGEELFSVGPDIVTMAFNSNGRYLVTEGREGLIQVWDMQNGERTTSVNSSGESFPMSIVFKPDDSMFATSKLSGEVIFWSFSPEKIQESFKLLGHTDDASGIAFSPDGRLFYSTSFDGTIRKWDISPAGNSEFGRVVKDDVNESQMFADNKILITVGDDGTMRHWDTNNWEEQSRIQAHNVRINALDISPDQKYLATAAGDGSVKVWDTSSWEEIYQISAHSTDGPGFYDGAFDVEFSPDGKKLVTGGADDNKVKLWNVSTGNLIHEFQGTSEWVARTIFSPNGKYVAAAGGEIFNPTGTVTIWDVTTGELLLNIEPNDWKSAGRGFWGLDFSPDGTLLALGRTDSIYEVWKIPNGNLDYGGNEARRLYFGQSDSDFILTLRFSNDGERFMIGGSGLLEVRSAVDGELILALNQGPVWELETTADEGQIISIGFRAGVQILTLKLQELIELAHSRVTRSLTTEECQTYLHLDSCPDQ